MSKLVALLSLSAFCEADCPSMGRAVREIPLERAMPLREPTSSSDKNMWATV